MFESLDLAWSLLRIFPRELLKKITKQELQTYYARRGGAPAGGAEEVRAFVCFLWTVSEICGLWGASSTGLAWRRCEEDIG